MSHLPTTWPKASLTIVLAALAVAPRAQASGYLTTRFGADHGAPTAGNAFAVYFNPAALTDTKGTQLTGDLELAMRSVTYERSSQALSPSSAGIARDPNYVNANTGRATLFNVIPLPFLGATSDLGTKSFRVGYALYVPFGGSATWGSRDNWKNSPIAPGAVDGVQRWHNISGNITTIFNSFAAAYRIERARLSFGVNASLVYQTASSVRARNVDGTDDIRALNGGLKEGRSYLAVSGATYAVAVGFLWDPTEDGSLKIGGSYTSQPGFGETRMKGELTTQLGTAKERAGAQKVDFLQSWPDVARLGFSYRTSATSELRLDGEYVRWSVLTRQCVVVTGEKCNLTRDASGLEGYDPTGKVLLNVPREWQDAIGLRLGGAWFPKETVEAFGSVAVTTSAVPKETIDASTIDSNRYYVTLGAKYALSKKLAMAASYTHIFFETVDTEGRSKLGTYSATSRSPSADGTYRAWIGLLDVNATYTF